MFIFPLKKNAFQSLLFKVIDSLISSNAFDNQVLNDARNALISLGYKLKDVNDVITNEYKSKVPNDSIKFSMPNSNSSELTFNFGSGDG